MEWFQKRWTQVLSLALCCVLAAALVRQGVGQNGLREELAESRAETAALAARLDAAEGAREAAAQSGPARSVRFANASVNARDRMLTVEIRAELPDAQEHLPAVGFCRVGEPYRMAWKQEVLFREADGACAQTVTFPLDLEGGLELRLEDDTVLYSSDSMTALLPLQMEYGGVSWHYDCQRQIFYLSDWTAVLTDVSGEEATAADGEFRVYRNGKPVFRGREVPDSFCVEVDGALQDGSAVPCAPGDRMRLCYACTDAFGLRYEFPLMEVLAMRWDDMEACPLSRRPAVSWPE